MDVILLRLEERDRREQSFIPLVLELGEIQSQNTYLTQRLAELEDQLAAYKHQSTLTPSQSAQLQQEQDRFRQELADAYKQLAQHSQRIITLTDEHKDLQDTFTGLERENQQLQKQVALSTRQIGDLQALVKEKDAALQVLQDEHVTLQLELNKTAERCRDLENENRVLVERWLRKMNQEAERMNEVNQMMESVMSKRESTAQQRIDGQSTVPTGFESVMLGRSRHVQCQLPQRIQYTIQAHEPECYHTAMGYDAGYIVTGGADKRVKVFETRSGALKYNLTGCVQSVMCVDVSSGDELVLGASNDHSVRVWNLKTGRSKLTLTGHIGYVWAARFTADTQQIVSGAHDRTLKLWDISKTTCLRSFFTQSSVNDIAITTDGGIISAHVDNSLRFWDSRTGDCIKHLTGVHSGQITSVLKDPRDPYLMITLSRDNTLKHIDMRTFNILKTLTASSDSGFRVGWNYTKACVSPDGRYVIAPSHDGALFSWDMMTTETEV